MPKQQIAKRAIVDSTGSYVVSYLPNRKIQLKLPGTEHVVIIGPIRSRTNTGIVIVNTEGAITNIPAYHPEK
jgi:RPA family protein